MGQSSSTQTTETTCDVTENVKESLSLLLMGKTGHGKSSLGNCILGCETFKVSDNTNSQTAEVECAYSEFESFSLKVVDGPGLHDTQLSELNDTQRAVDNMGTALAMCCEGVDAFLFVFRYGVRFTPEEVTVFATLKATFGKNYLKHAIVVLTHGEQFPIEERTFDDWCEEQTGPFRELYEACDGRCVLFNNKEMEEEKQMAQRQQITLLAHDLKRRHRRYTADSFIQAEIERHRLIITLKLPILKEEIQKQISILYSKIQKYNQQQSLKQRAEIMRAIRKLQKEIEKEDKGLGLLTDLMETVENVERYINDVTVLTKLAAALEIIRKSFESWRRVGKLVMQSLVNTRLIFQQQTD